MPSPAGAWKRAALSRRAAVSVTVGLAAFVVLQLAAAAVLETRLTQAIDPAYGLRLQCIRQGRAADPRTVTVVALGSSRTYNGLRTPELNASLSRELGRPVSVVNAAVPGGGPATQLVTWRRLRRDGIRPDLVLIEAFPGLLTDAHATAELREDRMPADRLGWLDLPPLRRYGGGTRPGLSWDAARASFAAMYTYRLGIMHALAPRLLDPGANALIATPGPALIPEDLSAEQRAKALEAAHHLYAGVTADPNSRNGRALCELLDSCQKADIPAALVLMPEGPVFRSWYPPGAWTQCNAWLEDVGRRYGAPLFNAREWIDDEDAFLDSHHLLPKGAARFTDRLGRECLGPMLLQMPGQRSPPLPPRDPD